MRDQRAFKLPIAALFIVQNHRRIKTANIFRSHATQSHLELDRRSLISNIALSAYFFIFIFCLILFFNSTRNRKRSSASSVDRLPSIGSVHFLKKYIRSYLLTKLPNSLNINLGTLQIVTGRSDKLLLPRVNLMQLESGSVVEAKK